MIKVLIGSTKIDRPLQILSETSGTQVAVLSHVNIGH